MRSRLSSLDRPARLGAVVVLALVAFMVLVFSQAITRLLAPDGETVRAEFASVGQLRAGDKVRVDGVDVGKVDGIDLRADGRGAVVALRVEDDALPLYADARASIRWRTLLGGNLAVELDRGTATAGPFAGRIPMVRTANQVELDDLMVALRGRPQLGLKTFLGEGARGLRDETAPAKAFDAVADAGPAIAAGLAAAQGRGRDDLEALVGSAAKTAVALATPDRELQDVIEGGARTFAAVSRRSAEVRRTFRLADARFDSIQGHLARLDRSLEHADPVLRKTAATADAVAPALRATRPVLSEADVLLRRARPLMRSLRPTARHVAAAARDAAPLVDELRPSLGRLEQTILPALAERDAVSRRTTYEMIGPTIAGLAGAMGQFDGEGLPFFRFPASFREGAVDSLPCKALLTDPERESLIVCDQLSDTLKTYFNYLTKPGGR